MNKDKAWPKSAGWLWKRIKEVLPVLVAAGIETHRKEDKSGSKIVLRKVPRSDATTATGGENRTERPNTDGIKDDSNATTTATGSDSNATDGNSEGSSATFNATGKADRYAGYGNGGNSGNRNGASWQSDPMRHYRRGGVA